MMTQERYVVIHPLDDRPEEKVDVGRLGPMAMTRTVRVALFSLRAYLMLMIGVVAYQVMAQVVSHR